MRSLSQLMSQLPVPMCSASASFPRLTFQSPSLFSGLLAAPSCVRHFAMSTKALRCDKQRAYAQLYRTRLWEPANTCPRSLTRPWTIPHFIAACAKAPPSVSNRSHKAISQKKADAVAAPLNNLSSSFYPHLALGLATEPLHPRLLVGWIRCVCVWWVSRPLIHRFICARGPNIMCHNAMNICVLNLLPLSWSPHVYTRR